MNDFWDIIPEDEKLLVQKLREIILNTAPNLREKFSYNVPYFFGKQRICYLWPASVSNGGFKAGVSLGFCKGYLLDLEDGILQLRNRKQVASIEYLDVTEINIAWIRQKLIQAIQIDEMT